MRYLPLLLIALALTACDRPTESGDAADSQAPAVPVAPAAEETVRPTAAGVASSAEETQPLKIGDMAPTQSVQTVAGESVAMSDIYSQQPTVLVFYRGGWCPYCNTQLSDLAGIKDQLNSEGFQIVAISPDRPEKLRETMTEQELDYTLLSDADADLITAFGLAFEVDQPTRERYTEYGIDLAEASGHDHHILPVPAVYLIDTTGQIRFAYANADYKTRLDGDQLLEAARSFE